jgi:hypothetical protein
MYVLPAQQYHLVHIQVQLVYNKNKHGPQTPTPAKMHCAVLPYRCKYNTESSMPWSPSIIIHHRLLLPTLLSKISLGIKLTRGNGTSVPGCCIKSLALNRLCLTGTPRLATGGGNVFDIRDVDSLGSFSATNVVVNVTADASGFICDWISCSR